MIKIKNGSYDMSHIVWFIPKGLIPAVLDFWPKWMNLSPELLKKYSFWIHIEWYQTQTDFVGTGNRKFICSVTTDSATNSFKISPPSNHQYHCCLSYLGFWDFVDIILISYCWHYVGDIMLVMSLCRWPFSDVDDKKECWWHFLACWWHSIGNQFHLVPPRHCQALGVVTNITNLSSKPLVGNIRHQIVIISIQILLKWKMYFQRSTNSSAVLIYNFILFILLFYKIIKLIKYDLITNYFLCSSFMYYELCRTGCSTQKVILNSWILTLKLTVFRSDIEMLERCETWK